MASPPRILLCGDVLGHLDLLFKRVQSVNKSAAGPFDALLCVGQFFPETSDDLPELSRYLGGDQSLTIPTYFTGDYGCGAPQTLSNALRSPSNRGGGFKTDGIELCPNLFWLKGSGKFYLHGLSVAYLSGRCEKQSVGVYSEDDVGALQALSEDPGLVDIFLTNEWPSGVCNGADVSGAPEGVSDASGYDPIAAELVAVIKPRYHIAGTKGVFYARDPYINDKAAHVTRFIGLGSVGNKKKEKFIYAISPTPASSMIPSEVSSKPPNTTPSPYALVNKVFAPSEAKERVNISDNDSQYWRYDTSRKRQKCGGGNLERICFKFTSTGSCNHGEKCNFRHDEEARSHYLRNICFDYLNKGKCDRGPDCKFKHSFSEEDEHEKNQSRKSGNFRGNFAKKCWFCLSSPEVESHLLISVWESYYCALAKGPLVRDHVLLIPVEHSPNTLSVSPEADIELRKFKHALRMYFKKLEKAVVFYEWVSPHTPHANLQVIPVPLSRASHVRRAFTLASKRLGFEFAERSLTNGDGDVTKFLRTLLNSSSFFYIELPDDSLLIHSDPDQEKFPVQFGREVLAGMLNMADRADWRSCKLNKEDEIKMVEAFKVGFAEFDPAG